MSGYNPLHSALYKRRKLSSLDAHKVGNIGIRHIEPLNTRYLRKLVFLCNHLTQYYSVEYDEIVFRMSDLKIPRDSLRDIAKNTNPEDIAELIWFMPMGDLTEYPNLNRINLILHEYITNRQISKSDMQTANDIWMWLKKEAGIDITEPSSQHMEEHRE